MNVVSWFSAGISSALATKIALNKYPDMTIVYIDIDEHHPDNKRFITECSKWLDREIVTIKSPYESIYNAFKQFKYIAGVRGAKCTQILKKRVRKDYEASHSIDLYIWGMDASQREQNRANRLNETMPEFKHEFPLIDAGYTKENVHYEFAKSGIEKPTMYKLGYSNNNCIGCVKGGKGYWNKIRVDFPDMFKKAALIEREIGASCINGCYLDELPEGEGHKQKPIVDDCGIHCENLLF